jgi:hypothetical protein
MFKESVSYRYITFCYAFWSQDVNHYTIYLHFICYYLNLYTIYTSQSKSCVTADGQSASLSWNKAPIWGLRPDFYYCQTVAGLLGRSLWRDNCSWSLPEKSFSGPSPVGPMTIYYSLRFETSFSSPPTTRRVTVEVFEPGSIREWLSLHIQKIKFKPGLKPLGTGRVGNTAPQCCSSIVSIGKCLFEKPLLSNGSYIFNYLAVVVQQRVYMLNIYIYILSARWHPSVSGVWTGKPRNWLDKRGR